MIRRPVGRVRGEYLWKIPDPPEGQYQRYEVLDGEFVASGFPLVVHQHVLGGLLVPLATFVRAHRLGELIMGPFGVILTDYDAVQPDAVFVSCERLSILSNRAVEGVPDLIVEITEPATSDRDRGVKLRQYAATGVCTTGSWTRLRRRLRSGSSGRMATARPPSTV